MIARGSQPTDAILSTIILMATDLLEESARCQIRIVLAGEDVSARPKGDGPAAGGGISDIGIRRRWTGDGHGSIRLESEIHSRHENA